MEPESLMIVEVIEVKKKKKKLLLLKLLRRKGGWFCYLKLTLVLQDMPLEIQRGKKSGGDYFHWVFLVTFELNLEECPEFYHVINAREIHERDDLREDIAPTVEQI